MSRNKEDKKRGAVTSAVIIIVVLAVFVGLFCFPSSVRWAACSSP